MKTVPALARWFYPGEDILATTILFFFASAFAITPATLWTMSFYGLMVPVLIYEFYRGARIDWKHPAFVTAVILIGWSALTLLWGEDPGKGRISKYAFGAVSTFAYLAALTIDLRANKMLARRIGSVFIAMGALNAVFCIIVYFLSFSATFNFAVRLTGWAETRHAILGALIIGVAFLFALDRFLHEKENRIFTAFAIGACLAFIGLTQSRGPYMASAAGALLLLASVPGKQKWRFIGGLAIAGLVLTTIGLVLFHISPMGVFSAIMERGDSHRFEIWSYTMQRVAENPFFGHGPAAYLGLADYPAPHDLYLATLFYNGMVGLVLLLTMLALAMLLLARRWRRDRQAPLLAALLLHGLIGGLTDLSQVAPGPGPIWIIFWLPLALIFAAPIEVKNASAGRE